MKHTSTGWGSGAYHISHPARRWGQAPSYRVPVAHAWAVYSLLPLLIIRYYWRFCGGVTITAIFVGVGVGVFV